MDKLRDETLDEILKKEKAYPHELRAIIPELKLLRQIYDGKRPPEDYYSEDAYVIKIPMLTIINDARVAPPEAVLAKVGESKLTWWSSWPDKRFVIHRVK